MEVLKPLKQITGLFSEDQYPTIGQVVLYSNQLIDHFENLQGNSTDPLMKTACKEAVKKALKYYHKNCLSDNWLFVMMFNPHIKTEWLDYACELDYVKASKD